MVDPERGRIRASWAAPQSLTRLPPTNGGRDDGEVSPYVHDVVVEGDRVEVRGPFASYFVPTSSV